MAETGPDRFHARPDALVSSLKENGFHFVYLVTFEK